jgi:uncharacterized RDD family membrane protein YckC
VPKDIRAAAGSWLEGSAFGRGGPRGARLGLPEDGPGSLASPGIRIGAFVLDAVVANLLAGVPYLFGVRYGQGDRGVAVYVAFLVQEFLLDSVAGGTIGKQLCRIRVVREADGGRLSWPWVVVRTILLGLLIPAVIWDRDGRGLHDRAAGALTIRTGPPTGPTPAPSRREASAPAATAAPIRSGAPAARKPAPAVRKASRRPPPKRRRSKRR